MDAAFRSLAGSPEGKGTKGSLCPGSKTEKGKDFPIIGAAQDGQSCLGKLMPSPSQEMCKLRLEAGAKVTFQIP